MSLTEIQRAVDTLSVDERRQITTWMVSHYPLLRVEQLMASAAGLVATGEWTPSPPTDESRPHAARAAEELDGTN